MNKKNNIHSLNTNSKAKDTKEKYSIRVYNSFYKEPMTRRMAITNAGYPDQSFLITQNVKDWIKQNKACVLGKMKCKRSGHTAERITTNPELFPINPQLDLFIHSNTGSDE